MISTVLLTILNSFIGFLLALLPSGAIPSGISTAITYFWLIVNSFSYIFPVSTLLAAFLVLLAFDLAVLLWHLLQWILRKIPGVQ